MGEQNATPQAATTAAQPTAPPAAKKKAPARLGTADIMRLGEWVKANGKRLIEAGISPAGVARAAGRALSVGQPKPVEVTVNTLVNVAAGCGIAFPEQSGSDRLAKMEDTVLRLMFPPQVQVTAQTPPAKAA